MVGTAYYGFAVEGGVWWWTLGRSHVFKGGTDGKSVVDNRISRGDYSKMTVN